MQEDAMEAMAELGAALARVAALARRPEVRAVLMETFSYEVAAVAAGFRQRFPEYWPGAQQPLPLPIPGGNKQ